MSKGVPAIAVATIVALALAALYRLLLLQYESGDVYPEYSSYRADPLGTLILHDAFAAARGSPPHRNLAPLDRAAFPGRSTVLLAGASISKDEVSTLERVETFAASGGRFVVLFSPHQDSVVRQIEIDRAKEKDREKKEKSGETSDDAADEKADEKAEEDAKENSRSREDDMMDALMPRADISERWGFGYAIRDLPADAKKKRVADVRRGALAPATLPEKLPWHSSLIFTDLGPEWTVIYERAAHPVVIERAWGEGRIVVAADNYLVSNEAMLADRAPAYLAWLAGSGRTLVFEETHLGVARSTGIMTLARQYGLVPMLCAGIVLTLLFIWRNAVPLVPKRSAARNEDGVVAAHSTVSGIAGLARRAVRPQDILETCWRLYQAPSMRHRPIDAVRRAAIEAALATYRELPARRRNPAPAYNAISAIINERKTHP